MGVTVSEPTLENTVRGWDRMPASIKRAWQLEQLKMLGEPFVVAGVFTNTGQPVTIEEKGV